MMKLRLLRGFLPRPRPLKIFIRRSMGHSADTSDSSTNQDREAGRNSSKAEHSNPAPIGQFYRFLCRADFSTPTIGHPGVISGLLSDAFTGGSGVMIAIKLPLLYDK